MFLLVVFERALLLICARWTLIVASALGILLMYFAVSPGHVLNYPLLTDLAHLSCTGINASTYRYLM